MKTLKKILIGCILLIVAYYAYEILSAISDLIAIYG